METFNHPVGLWVETAGGRMRNFQRFTDSAQMEDVNWAPRSAVKRAETPKHEIQVEIKARAQDSAEIEVNGVASGHGVVQSIIVKL